MWQRALRYAVHTHINTKDAVIRRFLALQVGDQCDELRRAESERILRAQPFLTDADIVAIPDGNGEVVLDVTTIDETSLILDGSLSAKSPHIRSIRVGNENLMGDAIYAAAKWSYGEVRNPIWGKVTAYQFLGRPYQLSLWGGRKELGSDWAMEASHPFLTDLQRISWRTTAGADDGYFFFRRPGAEPAAVKMNRDFKDIGGVVRIGEPGGRLALLGGSISHETEDPGRTPLVIRGSEILPDTTTALMNRFQNRRSTRINALAGIRSVKFVRVNGFDALEGAEDLRTGLELSTLLGKGIKGLQGQDDDFFTSSELYGGLASTRSFAGFDMFAEGRRARGSQWDGILANGRSAFYVKPTRRHTLIADLTWSAGWKQRVPFQLTFADPTGGLRGFRDSDIGGAKRLIARFEERYVAGRIPQVGSYGFAAFADVGKLWAGDAPLGVNSPLAASVGVSLLAAVPAQSRRLWRIDVAIPVRGGGHHGVEVRFINHDFTRIFRKEPGDIYSSRERSVPSSVFNWP